MRASSETQSPGFAAAGMTAAADEADKCSAIERVRKMFSTDVEWFYQYACAYMEAMVMWLLTLGRRITIGHPLRCAILLVVEPGKYVFV